jgi:hypothetical protein
MILIDKINYLLEQGHIFGGLTLASLKSCGIIL